MAYGVLILSRVAATNIDPYNRTAISGSDIENGFVFRLDSVSTGSGVAETYAVTQVATGSLVNVWMAYSPEITDLYAADGVTAFRGLLIDPRNFIIKTGKMIDAYKPAVGDVIVCTADCFTGARTSEGYACASNGQWQLAWTSTHEANALAYRYLATEYITIASGSQIGSHRVTAYKLECIAA